MVKHVGLFEIRFHGRGGQGAKSAAAILATTALETGKQIQSFPEYGAERQGAPVKAYTRISDKPIFIHTGVTQPDLVVVLDETLLKNIPVAQGLNDKGILIANTDKSAQEVQTLTKFSGKIITLDATKIALDTVGKNIPNTPMLGAIAKVTGLVSVQALKENVKHKFERKLSTELVNKNLEAVQIAADKVKK
ncbi:pyruvate synthase [Candidatus Woesearchaeota archaeon]|nr:pyruvate synthase [Candidatus Woesearchaeota archaeon]